MGSVARPESSTSRIITIFFLIIAGVIAWFVAPMFLPMWRWQNVDPEKISRESKVPVKQLMQEYEIVFRYAPRGNNESDPFPFQIVTSNPTWLSTDETSHAEEEKTLVRCIVISDKNGEPPSRLYIGNTYKDRYFSAKVWRYPPGTFGKGAKRPVILYRALSLEKLDIGRSQELDREIGLSKEWQNDDEWDERYDGWDPVEEAQKPADAAAAAQEKAAAEAAKAAGGQ